MNEPAFSVILLATNKCNVACDYCFEDKTPYAISPKGLPLITEQILDYMQARRVTSGEIYWQGGEAMLLSPDWYDRANDVMGEAAAARGMRFRHFLQSNMIGYTPKWDPVIRKLFDNSVGTSMDFPNQHRKLFNGSAEQYTQIWQRNVRRAKEAGIQIGVIAVLHSGSFQAGAEAFYEYFVDELGIDDFQVNTPFPGGPAAETWTDQELDHAELDRFLIDLMNVWLERGLDAGVRLGPFDALIDHFSGREAQLPCIWTENCANQFVSIDAKSNVALCDCWVTSYPDRSFGNLKSGESLVQIMRSSPVRREFLGRPAKLVREDECLSCEFLSMCHGGCPVRAQAWRGDALLKDPFCSVYKSLFSNAREAAVARLQHEV
jgi:uncharacterized protein